MTPTPEISTLLQELQNTESRIRENGRTLMEVQGMIDRDLSKCDRIRNEIQEYQKIDLREEVIKYGFEPSRLKRWFTEFLTPTYY